MDTTTFLLESHRDCKKLMFIYLFIEQEIQSKLVLSSGKNRVNEECA